MARQLYLDCDGVLADFDKGATAILGLPPRAFEQRHGLRKFWARLAEAPDFYFGLPLMPDAMRLFEAVRHLDPIILTGLPRGNWAADQKVRWAAHHFPGTRIITTMARDKRDHCRGRSRDTRARSSSCRICRRAAGPSRHRRSHRAWAPTIA
jgi:hypothetical protein